MSLRASPAAAEANRWRSLQRAGRRWAVWGGLLGLLGAMLLFAPAQWLANALQQASGQRLLLAEARGSLWDGSAVLVLTGGAGSRDAAALPGRLSWQLRPTWQGLQLRASQPCCLTGALQLHWSPAWGGYSLTFDGPALRQGSGAAVLGAALPGAKPVTSTPTSTPASSPTPTAVPSPDGGMNTDGARGSIGKIGEWPASWLAGLGTPWNTLQLGGALQLASPGLRLQHVNGQLRLDGALALDLHNVSSRLSALPVLGSYRLGLRAPPGGGDSASVQLDTLDGALRLSGTGQWAGGRLRFRGEAQAADGQDAVLSNLLNIIGRRQGALSVISIG